MKDDLVEKALEMINSTSRYKVEDVSVNISEYGDGLKKLSIDIDYNDSRYFIPTKDGGMWVKSE